MEIQISRKCLLVVIYRGIIVHSLLHMRYSSYGSKIIAYFAGQYKLSAFTRDFLI